MLAQPIFNFGFSIKGSNEEMEILKQKEQINTWV